MNFKLEEVIEAPREEVWKALNDPVTLARCVPGCEALEQVGDDEFLANIVIKVGPVKVKFKANLRIKDRKHPEAYTLEGDGQGGVAGFASGAAHIQLLDVPDGRTRLLCTSESRIGGKLAQLGSRLVEGAANKLAAEFMTNLREALSVEQQ
jgi:carbon monoxide dehydrogenase subunit G